MSVFGHGPAHVNGTRLFWEPPPSSGGGASHKGTPRYDHLMNVVRPRWMDRTDLPCKQPDVDADWWYAPEGFKPDLDGKLPTLPRHAEKAVQLCNTCPMRAACELHGLRNEPFGIWGGRNVGVLKTKQRAALLKQLERPRRRTA